MSGTSAHHSHSYIHPLVQLGMSHPSLTSSDPKRAIDHLYDIAPDPSCTFPLAYTYLANAGSGTYGDVYFCVPSVAVLEARSELTVHTDINQVRKKLTNQLLAVKICHGPSIPNLVEEIKTLHSITATNHAAHSATRNPPIAGCNAFFELLDHGVCLSSDAHYLALPTLPLACTLETLYPRFSPLPEVFTWLIYVRITTALTWLHDVCVPGIAHGDVHLGNILVGYPALDPGSGGRLPQVKMIDFGNARVAGTEAGCEYTGLCERVKRDDLGGFLRVLAWLLDIRGSRVDGVRGCGSVELSRFRTLVEGAIRRGSWDRGVSLFELESRFGDIAKRTLEQVEEKELQEVWKGIVVVTEGRREAVRRRLEALLEM